MNRERIFNLPGVVTALIAVLFGIQVLVELFPQSVGAELMVYFSFIPARFSFLLAPNSVLRALAEVDIDGDELAAFLNTTRFSWWTPLTYAFLHANWTHLGVNSLTLAAFGAPVAKRLGSARFLVFFAVTAIAGALAHLAAHPFDLGPVVGASAAISGAMGAIVRFAFAHGEALGEPKNDPSEVQPDFARISFARAAVLKSAGDVVHVDLAGSEFGVRSRSAGARRRRRHRLGGAYRRFSRGAVAVRLVRPGNEHEPAPIGASAPTFFIRLLHREPAHAERYLAGRGWLPRAQRR